MTTFDEGAPLYKLAEYLGVRGWQLVPTQWHRNDKGKSANTPIAGVTGSAPFLDVAQMVARAQNLVLHRQGGPDCVGAFAKPAIRPPLHVVAFDVDDGYEGKGGGETLVKAESVLGPLPATWTLTARGQWSPSRRRWYRIPPDLVVMDRFFEAHGGFIETVRTGHRYSWCAPAIHVRKGEVVGPVLWYGPDQEVAETPRVDDLGELPAAWVQAIREDNARRAQAAPTHGATASGMAIPVTAAYADGVVRKLTQRLHDMPPAGGEFRSTVYGLASALMRRENARDCDCGDPEVHALYEFEQVFADHPLNLTPDSDDLQWFADGVEAATRQPWRFVDEWFGLTPTLAPVPTVAPMTQLPSNAATDDELLHFVQTYRRFNRPDRLGRRTYWMKTGSSADLLYHASCLVQDVLAGHYPARAAFRALTAAYQHHGGTDPSGAVTILRVALGAALDAPRKATA